MILFLENNIRGGVSSVLSNRYVKSDENKKILYFDSNILYGHAMSLPLPYDEIKFDKNVKLEDILNTPDDSDIGYFIETDLKYPHIIKERTESFPFCPENKKNNSGDYSEYEYKESIKPNNYTQTKKLICDFSDNKNYLTHYRMSKNYVRYGMEVEKVHTVISFKQSKCLEKYISFNNQKRKKAKNDF